MTIIGPNINHKKFFRRFLISAAPFLVVFNHFWIWKICRSSTYHHDIKENIITKLQKVYSPLRNFRVCNKSPMLFLKKPLCMGHVKPGPKIFTERPVIVRKEDHFLSSVVKVLPCSGCFITCMGAHFPELSWIMQSSLAPFLGCQGSCDIVPSGATGSVAFLYTPGLEVLACNLHTDLNYANTMLQLCPSLNH